MSKENVEAVHRGVDAMNRGELDSIVHLWAMMTVPMLRRP